MSSRSGPAPSSVDRSHKAKADSQGWTTLPAEGRKGDTPAFPLIDPNGREREIWERLWGMPQAVQWEASNLEIEVAAYVRLLARAELPDSVAMLWAQVKQIGESLGLTAAGMLRNKWTVAPVAEDGESPTLPAGAPVSSLTARLKAVADG
jgi:hypothetical protein